MKKTKQATRAQLSVQYGISVPAIDRAKAKGVDVADPGAMIEYLENRERPGKTDSTPGSADYQAARTKLVNLQCEKIRLAIDREQGALVDRTTVDAVMFEIGRGFKETWLMLPDSLPPRLVGLDEAGMKKVLMTYVREVLITVANGDCFDLDENGMLKLEQ